MTDMRVLFCNITLMKYYKGNYPGIDEPVNGGDYVKKTHDAAEKFNFLPIEFGDARLCVGHVETKSTNGVDSNQLHVEKIEGGLKEYDVIDNVLVIWCARQDTDNRTVVVGWYRNADVFRYYQENEDIFFEDELGTYISYYNIVADADDCVLLPVNDRNKFKWNVPRKGPKGAAFGFGSANVWFGREELAQGFINKLVQIIDEYDGENWLCKEVE